MENSEKEGLDQEDDRMETGDDKLEDKKLEDNKLKDDDQEDDEIVNKQPILVFAFDEAHVLTETQSYGRGPINVFNELQKALCSIQSLDIFTLFVSTSTIIVQFGGNMATNSFNKTQLHVGKPSSPYSDVGFDHFALSNLSGCEPMTLGEVSSIETIVSFGRPL